MKGKARKIMAWLAITALVSTAAAGSTGNPLQEKLTNILGNLTSINATKAVSDSDFGKRKAGSQGGPIAEKITKPVLGVLNLTEGILTDYGTGQEDNKTEVGGKLGQLRTVMRLPTGVEEEKPANKTKPLTPAEAAGTINLTTNAGRTRALLGIRDNKNVSSVIREAKRLKIIQVNDTPSPKKENEFAEIFDGYAKQLKTEARKAVKTGSDKGLAANVIQAIANRELSRIRELELTGLKLSEKQAAEEIREFAQLGSEDKPVLERSLNRIDPEFKKKMALIALNGSIEEKMLVREQVREYVKLKGDEKQLEMASRVKNRLIDAGRIRSLLELQLTAEMIWSDLET